MKPEPYDILRDKRAESRCPYLITKLAGDETYDTCKLRGKSCIIEGCEEYLKETEDGN